MLVCVFLDSDAALIVSNLSLSIFLLGDNYNSSKILLISLVSGPFILGYVFGGITSWIWAEGDCYYFYPLLNISLNIFIIPVLSPPYYSAYCYIWSTVALAKCFYKSGLFLNKFSTVIELPFYLNSVFVICVINPLPATIIKSWISGGTCDLLLYFSYSFSKTSS